MQSTLPSLNQRIYAPYKICAMVEVLEHQGIPAEDTLRGSEISPGELYDAFTRSSLHQFLTVCENAIALSRDPATPFLVGSHLQLSSYGMYGFTLLSCMSIRDYFRMAIKYRRLATSPMIAEWVEDESITSWSFPNSFTFNPSAELKRFLMEIQFSTTIAHIRETSGSPFRPLRAAFSYPAPPHRDIYEEYLEYPCLFDQPQCDLVYDRSILEWRPPKAHMITTALLQEVCDHLIQEQKVSEGISSEVYKILTAQTGDFPSMEAVAKKLNITSRTLRRHLAAEQTSFQAIMDDARRSLATEYLKTSNMNASDVGMLVGFNDAANFRRALKRWTGKGPRELREKSGKP